MRKLPLLTILLGCIPLLGSLQAKSGDNPYLHQVGTDGSARFELKELTGHPHFWWPRTLLNYRVIPSAGSATPAQWSLEDAKTGAPVPMQVSEIASKEGKVAAATVSFFSDLPTGAERSFVLRTFGNKGAGNTAQPAAQPAVTLRESKEGIILDTGVLKIRLPASLQAPVKGAVPGPIMALDDERGWVGESSLRSPSKRVSNLRTEILDRGPLFARVRMTYRFDGGATYTAIVKAAAGEDYLDLQEYFSGLTKEDDARFEFRWKGLRLTHRRGDEPIKEPKKLYYRGEDPHFTGPARIEDPAREFYFRVGHSAADSTTQTTSMDFSDKESGRCAGLCVLDGSLWDDGEYAIWASHDTLAAHFRMPGEWLEWSLPLAGRSRNLAVALYDARKGPEGSDHNAAARVEERSDLPTIAATGAPRPKGGIAFINSRRGSMSLDVVKEWILSYPAESSFPKGIDLPSKSPASTASLPAYLKALWKDNELFHPEGNWVHPVTLRIMSSWVVPGFNAFRTEMDPAMREKITALLLFQSYLAAREEVSPMLHMLKGHPNFMADWKYPLMAGAFLFPDHPMAREWADQFQKFADLLGVFHVRPSVPAWDAKGGRWTENIGTYNWALLDPLVRANQLGLLFDGRDRIANPGFALHASYLAGIVTAPVKLGEDGKPFDFKPGTPLLPENGFQRIHPPQGAHSGRRHIPGSADELARSLSAFAPLVSEHLLWSSRRPAGSPTGAEGTEGTPQPPSPPVGTDPGLRSAKYTGYGVILRSAVGTPGEISVFLQQIDKGPNYRWGFGNEGGCGDIYYYARGNSYAGHFGEDEGDRRVGDAELTCNTGVYRDSTFRGIGMNDLTEPLRDLGNAQFAELLARPGPDAYSWPEYESRSVMLAGNDYIVTFDTVNGMSRMSWNTVQGQDLMPTLIPLRGETMFRTTMSSFSKRFGTSEAIRFEPYKGGGDRMVLVSHRKDVSAENIGEPGGEQITKVSLPEVTDYIYQMRDTFSIAKDGKSFEGRAGIIRQFKDGHTELSLFSGSRIGAGGMQIGTDNNAMGIGASFNDPGEASGVISSAKGGRVTFTLPVTDAKPPALHLNGAPLKTNLEGGRLIAEIPPGTWYWQLTSGSAKPVSPEIITSVTTRDGARISFTPVPSSSSYRIERSDAEGLSWQPLAETKETTFLISGIAAPSAFPIRVIALNGPTESLPGKAYPVRVTGIPPLSPTGLRVLLSKDEAQLSWGEVLGAGDYSLERRKRGEPDWREIYRGKKTSFTDHAEGIVPAFSLPGLRAAAMRYPSADPTVYEYQVRSVDETGIGDPSPGATTDPSSWCNWQPDTELSFRRRSAYWLPPYVTPEQIPPASYPK